MNTPPQWVQRTLTPEASDSADLRWAIETAAAMWARGDSVQGMRWLQHAVQTAQADGHTERAAALDRAAAELDRLTREPPSPEQPPMSAPSPSTSLRRTTPYKIALDDITRLVAPDASLLEQCEPTHELTSEHGDTDPDVTDQHSPPPASVETTPLARPRPPPTSSDVEPTLTAARPSRAVERTVVMEVVADAPVNTPPSAGIPGSSSPPSGVSWRFQAPSPEPAAHHESTRDYQFGAVPAEAGPPSSPKQISSHPITLGSPPSPLEPMRALRVAIEPAVGGRMTVIVLADGESAPAGMQEALLVPLGR